VPSFRRRFRQEARAMACLDHENIVKLYDISQDGEVPFIVAECVAGSDIGTLLSRHRGGHLDERFARRMAAQLLRALSYAHRRGVIHRDIKPSNILVTASGTIKVADFGIARIVEEDGVEAGEPGEIVGSARYMSPEQLMGREATPHSDLYSAGVLLYHCLTGQPPFFGNIRSLAQQHIHRVPTPPRKLNKKISPHMEAVLLKALAKNPDDRYPSAAAMLDDMGIEAVPRTETTAEVPRSGTPRKARKGFILASTLTLLVITGSALVFRLGYVDLPPYGDREKAFNRMESVATRETPAAPEPEAAASPSPRDLVVIPDVRAYFDYVAEERLTSRGFEVRFVYDYQYGYANRGVTWATDPAIGTLAPKGSVITVYATPLDRPQPQF
jgi:eukaryotic-like serine/threonine-protein kinase